MDKKTQPAKDALIGARIRERREIAGMKQSDLARNAGISASYLNLIEHNRRRIGGKLLTRIADELGIDPALLREGAEAALLGVLREADASVEHSGAELDRIEEFAGRFPGWARLIAMLHRRTTHLEHTIDGLNDRIGNDPALAAWVHEVLSTAASIRSTASILAETDTLEPEWLDRFHANINDDSARLAESSRALAGYLEASSDIAVGEALPQDEVDRFLSSQDYCFEGLESGAQSVEEIVEGLDMSQPGKRILAILLDTYTADAKRLPLSALRGEIDALGHHDPVTLARGLGTPVGLTIRRMASLPELGAGFVLCDRSGSLLLRKPIAGFDLPRFGATCPLWPVFQAFSQPGTVIRQEVAQLGRQEVKFDCFAIAETSGVPRYNMPPLFRSGMLILPAADSVAPARLRVGATCRICPRAKCPGRREPAVVPEIA